MTKNKYTYTEANTEAQAGLDASLVGMSDAVRTGSWRSIEDELTVAKIIEIESQKASQILWLSWGNKKVEHISSTEQAFINAAKAAQGQANAARWEINKIEEAAKKEPIEKTKLEGLKNNLNTLGSRKADAICSSRDVIILFAGVKKTLDERLMDAPTMAPANITLPSPLPTTITDIPFKIEWIKWADETIEILDSADRVIDSYPGSPSDTNFICDKIKDLKNGRTTLKIRATNTTTKVYHEYTHTCTVDIPEIPDNFNQNISTTTLPAVITGTLKNRSHGVQLLKADGTMITQFSAGTTTPGADGETIQIFGDGSFRIEIPNITNGTHNYQLGVKWTGAIPLKLPFTITANLTTLPTDVPPEAPDGIQKDIEITTEPHTISGKLKNPKHSIELLNDSKWPIVPAIRPTIGTDGTFSFQLPPCWSSRKVKYFLRVDNKNTAGWPTNQLDIEINVSNKAPIKKLGIIRGYDIKSLAEKSKKTWSDQVYKIKGHADDFRIGYTKQKWDYKKHFYAQVPDEHNHFHVWPINTRSHADEYVRANSPEELEEKIYERLHHINHHIETEYNSALGITEDEKAHEWHDEKHEKDNHAWEKHEKGEKHDKHEKSEEKHDKWGHAEGGDESSSWSFGAALKTVALAPVKLFNKQPAWVRGAEIGLGYALYSGGAVLLWPAVVAGAAVGAGWWGLKKLWRIKNPAKWGGDSHAHH